MDFLCPSPSKVYKNKLNWLLRQQIINNIITFYWLNTFLLPVDQ